MKKIKAIGFDYGGVIGGDPSIGHTFTAQSAALLGITVDEWRQAYFSLNHLLNTNKDISREVFWQRFVSQFGQPDKLEETLALDSAMSDRYLIVNQAIIALIDQLRESGYKVGLLSNATGEVAQKIKALNLEPHFDQFIFSIEISLQKPDKAAFAYLAKALGADLSELAFVDDAAMSLSTAADVGYTPILFKSYDQLVTDLTALKVL